MHDSIDDGCHYANRPKPEGEEKVKKIRNVLILLAALLTGYGMLITVAELPPYGMPDNPIHNEVYERYVNEAIEDTGVPNTVTAVVLDYRAYDTMFETIVLFTAALAAVIALKSWKKEGDR
jgi:multicomponent Na+:H+ antiporter subunit B